MKKVQDYINILQAYGNTIRAPVMKHLDGEIWELRPLRDRVLFAGVVGGRYVLLHQFVKKTQKTPKYIDFNQTYDPPNSIIYSANDLLHNVWVFYFAVLCKGKHLCHDLCGFRILVYKRQEQLALFTAADSKHIDLMSSELMYHTAAEMNGVGTVFAVDKRMILLKADIFNTEQVKIKAENNTPHFNGRMSSFGINSACMGNAYC